MRKTELIKVIKEVISEENKYPETKEMSYSNISEVRNTLKELNTFFVRYIHPQLSKHNLQNESSTMWRKIEQSIKLLDKNL